jgi:uncharacterized protein YndB with AHSA1/START domain
MTRIQQSLTINAPVEAVAAYVSDPNHLPEWNQVIERVWDVQTTPAVVGTTWKIAVKVMGAEHHVSARISSYEPPARLGVELVGGVPGMPGLAASMEITTRPTQAPSSAEPTRRPADEADSGEAMPAPGSTQVICAITIHLPMRIGGAALGAVVSPIVNDQLRRGLLSLKRILEASHQP